ncbi:hypothetical protein Slala05_58870 [Streptomyces lavendulae subsp. lavendulae]|nr:hypothetical protein Slala05_58870 [Streptomyces lavendulae subsp. lavendulae]
MIHWIALVEAPKSWRMLGIAMLTIVTSTRSMKAAVITMASASQRRGSTGEPVAAAGSAFRSSRTGPFVLSGDVVDVSVLMERNLDGM